MNNTELLAIQPAEYLKNGFYDNKGEIMEGLNGYNSTAMAYRLREEKADPDQLQNIVDQLDSILDRQDSSVDENPGLSLDSNTLKALDDLSKKPLPPTITEVFNAARPWVKDWRTFAALLIHLHRILAQFVLICSLPEVE
jgi:hypothetical protein